jgi:cytochrome c-type biogenesis protein CcmE
MLKNKKFIIGGIIVLIAAVVLGYIGFMGVGTYYYTVGEFRSHESALSGKSIRVSGIMQPDPVKEGLAWSFVIKDDTTEDTLEITYSGSVPETFKVGNQIVVEGNYNSSSGIFEGNTIVVKCASKYEPET